MFDPETGGGDGPRRRNGKLGTFVRLIQPSDWWWLAAGVVLLYVTFCLFAVGLKTVFSFAGQSSEEVARAAEAYVHVCKTNLAFGFEEKCKEHRALCDMGTVWRTMVLAGEYLKTWPGWSWMISACSHLPSLLVPPLVLLPLYAWWKFGVKRAESGMELAAQLESLRRITVRQLKHLSGRPPAGTAAGSRETTGQGIVLDPVDWPEPRHRPLSASPVSHGAAGLDPEMPSYQNPPPATSSSSHGFGSFVPPLSFPFADQHLE